LLQLFRSVILNSSSSTVLPNSCNDYCLCKHHFCHSNKAILLNLDQEFNSFPKYHPQFHQFIVWMLYFSSSLMCFAIIVLWLCALSIDYSGLTNIFLIVLPVIINNRKPNISFSTPLRKDQDFFSPTSLTYLYSGNTVIYSPFRYNVRD
jgi:hypothetical protein